MEVVPRVILGTSVPPRDHSVMLNVYLTYRQRRSQAMMIYRACIQQGFGPDVARNIAYMATGIRIPNMNAVRARRRRVDDVLSSLLNKRRR